MQFWFLDKFCPYHCLDRLDYQRKEVYVEEERELTSNCTWRSDLCHTFQNPNRNELLESALPRRQRTSEVPDWGKFGHQQVICTGYCNGNGDGNVLRRIGYPTDGDNNRSIALLSRVINTINSASSDPLVFSIVLSPYCLVQCCDQVNML